jgi:hypothetical protein
MFCPKCGTESTDDSQFCRKCGNTLTAPSPTSAGDRTEPSRFVLFFVLVAIAALIGWYVDHTTRLGPRTTPKTAVGRDAQSVAGFYNGNQTPPPQPQLRTVNIGKGALSVAALHYSFYTLPIPAGASNVRVKGHFQATGGMGNDVEVFLLNDEQFTNWKNGHATPTYYNSGKITVGDVLATLPDGVGTYYLVFNNNFSALTAKAVEFNGVLVFYQ